MAFKKTLNSILKKYQGFYRKRKKTTIFLTIVGAGLLIYGSLIIFEIAQFKRVEHKVNGLHSQVLSQFPEAIDGGIDKSCGHASSKYTKGRLGCGYGFSVKVRATNIERANIVANSFDKLLTVQKHFETTYKSRVRSINFSEPDMVGFMNEASFDLNDGFKGVGCSGGIDYIDKEGSTSKRSKLPKEFVRFSIYCGKSPSLIKHYQLREE